MFRKLFGVWNGTPLSGMQHINAIRDDYVNAVLKRIIQDEEYHIMILSSLDKGAL